MVRVLEQPPKEKRSRKSLLAAATVGSILAAFLLLTSFDSNEHYYIRGSTLFGIHGRALAIGEGDITTSSTVSSALKNDTLTPNLSKNLATTAITLPPYLAQNLASPSEPRKETETAIFWHVPKGGGTSIFHLYAVCMGVVVANEIGGQNGHANDESLEIISPWYQGWASKSRFVNVDASTPSGLAHAKELHLAESGLADIVFTPYIHNAVDVFTPQHKGRMFTLLRDPVDRAVSMFYYLQDASWEEFYSPDTKEWTVQQYAESDKVDRNWMVRMLSNKVSGKITEKELLIAKEVLRTKCLVGLTSRIDESVRRFNDYFGFQRNEEYGKPESDGCVDMILHKGGRSNTHDHPKIVPKSPEWEALAKVNQFDIQLYEYAVELFDDQKVLIDAATM